MGSGGGREGGRVFIDYHVFIESFEYHLLIVCFDLFELFLVNIQIIFSNFSFDDQMLIRNFKKCNEMKQKCNETKQNSAT